MRFWIFYNAGRNSGGMGMACGEKENRHFGSNLAYINCDMGRKRSCCGNSTRSKGAGSEEKFYGRNGIIFNGTLAG